MQAEVVMNSVSVIRGNRVVLNGLSIVFEGPGLYQVIGPNGAGKTTLLLTIMGFIKPQRGRVLVRVSKAHNSSYFSYMPQTYALPRDAPITVYEFVENYLVLTRPWPRLAGENAVVEEALKMVGVPRSLWGEKINKLSGGLAQRVMLARALALNAPIVLLDEPLSNIDLDGRIEIANLLAQISADKLVVITSHDPLFLLKHTKKILVLGYGDYAYGDVEEVLKKEILVKFYKKCALELERQIHIADWHYSSTMPPPW